MNPLEIMLGANRDEKSMKALSQGLRGQKDLASLAMLSGDQTVGAFGNSLNSDVENRLKLRTIEKEKEAQRKLTESYYNQQKEANDARIAHQQSVLAEQTRHNKATEGQLLTKALKLQNKDVRSLSQAMTKAQVPEIAESIGLINKELAKYGENGDLPGMGGISNTFLGSTTPEGRAMKSLVGRVRNIILKARSGGAVTPQEADRLYEEFSLGVMNTDQDFKRAWNDFQSVFQAGVQGIYAGYPEETQAMYNENLGGAITPTSSSEGDTIDYDSMGTTPKPPVEEGSSGVLDWSKM